MASYYITSRMRLTEGGKIGVGLFLAMPLLSGLAYGWYIDAVIDAARSYGNTSRVTFSLWAIAVTSFLWLCGCVMMFVGRTYDIKVSNEQPAAATSEPFWN